MPRRAMYCEILTNSVVLLLLVGAPAAAEDWTNFRGPRYDDTSRETLKIASIPADGPHTLWTREVGPAFSSFAVVGHSVFTGGTADDQQTVFCLDVKSGEVRWKAAIEPQFTDPDENLHGLRSTPTFDGGRIYILGGHSALLCLEAGSGKIVWRRELKNKPHWGYSGSVLIEGNLAIVTGGGSDGAMCAFDKGTGRPAWKCGDDPAAYATPYPFTFNGTRYVCGFMAQSFIIGELQTGRLVLRMPWESHSGVNAASPIYHDGHLLVSTGYGYGAGLFRLHPEGEGLRAEQVWNTRKLRNKFQTPILLDGRLYTSDEIGLKCLDFLSGERYWFKKNIRHGSLLACGEHLILLTEKGELVFAKASEADFSPLRRAKLFEGSSFNMLRRKQGTRCWTRPVMAGGRLFVRDHTTVICLDLSHTPRAALPARD